MADPVTPPGQLNTPTEPVVDPVTLATTPKTDPVEVKTDDAAKLFGKDADLSPEAKAAADKAAADKALADPKVKADAEAKAKADADAKALADANKPVELKLPEDVSIDKEALAKFGELAIAQKLAPEAQQALIDLQAQMIRDGAKSYQATLDATYKGWRTDSLKQFTTTELSHATDAIAVLADPEVKSFLEETKLGDHPMIIRMLSRFGAKLPEDAWEAGGKQPTVQKQNGATLLYGPGTEKRN